MNEINNKSRLNNSLVEWVDEDYITHRAQRTPLLASLDTNRLKIALVSMLYFFNLNCQLERVTTLHYAFQFLFCVCGSY